MSKDRELTLFDKALVIAVLISFSTIILGTLGYIWIPEMPAIFSKVYLSAPVIAIVSILLIKYRSYE